MILRLHKNYLLLAGFFYSYFFASISKEFLLLYCVHTLMFLSYLFVLAHISQGGGNRFSTKDLIASVFVYSFIVVTIYKYISYVYNNDFFVFGIADAYTYYRESILMASMPFRKSLQFYLSFREVEDLGMVLLSSTLYRLIESLLLLNIIYIIVGVITALGIYRICLNFMSSQYATICSVAYSTSSIILWFHSSGRKESFLCMLIIMFYDRYYRFLTTRNFIQLLYASLFLLGLLLFRPVLIFFCTVSVAMGFVLQKRKGVTGVLVIILTFLTFIALQPVFDFAYDRFLRGGDIDQLQSDLQPHMHGSSLFTYSVGSLGQVVGPFPTISPDNAKEMLSFFAPGLIYKILLSILFWFGVYYIFRLKVEMAYPLVFFALFEMIALVIVLDALELRKSLPHFFIVYIVAFWFMDKYDLSDLFECFKIRQRIGILFTLYSIFAFVIILIWNLRSNLIQ